MLHKILFLSAEYFRQCTVKSFGVYDAGLIPEKHLFKRQAVVKSKSGDISHAGGNIYLCQAHTFGKAIYTELGYRFRKCYFGYAAVKGKGRCVYFRDGILHYLFRNGDLSVAAPVGSEPQGVTRQELILKKAVFNKILRIFQMYPLLRGELCFFAFVKKLFLNINITVCQLIGQGNDCGFNEL